VRDPDLKRETTIMRTVIVATGAAAALFSSPAFTQQPSQKTALIPDFSGIWTRFSYGFDRPLSGPGPVTRGSFDRIVGDYTNPILKPEAAESVKKHGEIELNNGVAASAQAAQCAAQPCHVGDPQAGRDCDRGDVEEARRQCRDRQYRAKNSANLRQGNFEVGLIGNGGFDYNDARAGLYQWQTSTKDNWPRFSNPDYDGLMNAASVTGDQSKRAQPLERAEQVLLREMPILPIYFNVARNLVSTRVKGWQDNLLNITYVKDLSLQK
jgi:hypothetical protein